MMHIHSRSLLHTTRLVQQSVEESGKSTGIKHKNIRAHKLAHSKYEDKSYQLPKWKEALGEFVVRTFKLDMDKVRAGPVAGSYYYNLCKQQGLQY